MNLVSVNDELGRVGLAPPTLNALIPDQRNFEVLLLQPEGNIVADAAGVRNVDQSQAQAQHSAFLADAIQQKADLAITPEYSMPWKVLESFLLSDRVPGAGALWVLGCESITFDELMSLKARTNKKVLFIFEDLGRVQGRFLDPVVYVFSTTTNSSHDQSAITVALVQFKTCPMGDDAHFEINGLQTGSHIYYFGQPGSVLRLATIICSDAFALSDKDASDLYDRTLLIHIQLNPKPRQDQYRQYRNKLLGFAGDQTEVLCLNWAKDVFEASNGARKCWRNISGSAWYLRPDKFDAKDHTLSHNHRLGLYYTWFQDLRCHALFFNYQAAVYQLTATKVAHIGVAASLSRRRGPQVTFVREWNNGAKTWVPVKSIDDGFRAFSDQCQCQSQEMRNLAAQNPFAVERLLALCDGKITQGVNWHDLKCLDSCVLAPGEIVRRITVCQDTETAATSFRVGRFRSRQRLEKILASTVPPAIADVKAGFRFDWQSSSPHTNVASDAGRRATLISVGEDRTEADANQVFQLASDYLGRSQGLATDDIIEARQRLVVWRRTPNGDDLLCNPHSCINYDDPRTESPLDIARST